MRAVMENFLNFLFWYYSSSKPATWLPLTVEFSCTRSSFTVTTFSLTRTVVSSFSSLADWLSFIDRDFDLCSRSSGSVYPPYLDM
jgi:hypothetical protein